MNNLQIFNSPEFGQVRTIQQNGEPWFVGKDIEYEANKRGRYIYHPVLLFYKMVKI